MVVLAVAAPAAEATGSVPTLWETDGPVHAIVRSGDTIYLGGEFSRVGPHTGSGVALSSTSGAVDPTFPRAGGGAVFT